MFNPDAPSSSLEKEVLVALDGYIEQHTEIIVTEEAGRRVLEMDQKELLIILKELYPGGFKHLFGEESGAVRKVQVGINTLLSGHVQHAGICSLERIEDGKYEIYFIPRVKDPKDGVLKKATIKLNEISGLEGLLSGDIKKGRSELEALSLTLQKLNFVIDPNHPAFNLFTRLGGLNPKEIETIIKKSQIS